MAEVMTVLSVAIGLYQIGTMFKKPVVNLFSAIEPYQRDLFNCYNKAFKDVTGLNLKKEGIEGQQTILNSLDIYFENPDKFIENIEDIEKNLIELFGIDITQYKQIAQRFEENMKASNSYSIVLDFALKTFNSVTQINSTTTETNLLVKELHQNLIKEKEEITFTFSKKVYNQIPDYLFRKVISQKDLETHSLFGKEEYEYPLNEIILSENHIVLLSNAGEGKTTELHHLANYFYELKTELFPVLIPLNTYIDEKVEELIISEWIEFPGFDSFPEDKILLIFDGYDEIQAKDKDNFRRRITSISNKYPNIFIVISSRTNFYTNPEQNSSGTISNFKPYYLTKLKSKQIQSYMLDNQKKFSWLEIEKFRKENFDSEFLTNPFNLVKFTEYIIKKESLPKSKADIFDFLIQDSVIYDIEKYKNKEEELRLEIMGLLSRLARIMENLCRNFLKMGELEIIFPNNKDIKLLNYSTLWDKHNRKFIHNNFQEYLAARELSMLKFEDIRKQITFSPENDIIIPSWSNTISFLINILDESDPNLKSLFDLIVKSNPEIIIKAEPGQISEKFRIDLVKKLFNESKEKMLYFRVNYATHWELVRFCETKDIVKFLIDEINETNIYIAKLSALKLISYLNNYYTYEDTLIEKILVLIFSENEDSIISTSIDIIAKSKPLTEERAKEIINKFKTTDSDYILTSVLRLIDAYYLNDEFINCILFSLESALESFGGYSDDGKVHLIDLDITVKEVIKKLQIEASIFKMLNWFSENQRNIHRDTFTGEILDHLISASVKLFTEGSDTIFDKIYSFFSIIYIDIYGKEYLRFLEFFVQTKTYIQLVESVLTWSGNNHIEFQKIDILYQLMKGELYDEIAKVIFDKLTSKEIDNEFMHRLLHQFRMSNNEHLDDIHQKLIKVDPEYFKISEQVQPNWEKIREEIELRDFSNILDIDYWKGELKKIYKLLRVKEVKDKNLSELYKIEHKEQVSKFAKDFLSQICRTSSIAQDKAIEILESRFEWIVIDKFYVAFKNGEKHKLDKENTEKHFQWILDWCNNNINEINFRKSVSNSKTGYKKNIIASYIEFFMMHLSLKFSYDKMLDMLSSITIWNTFEYVTNKLEELNKKPETRERIKINLKENNIAKPVLHNHIMYCKENRIKEVLPICYSILVEFDSAEISQKYLKEVAFSTIKKLEDDDYTELKKIFKFVNDGFEWKIIDDFIEHNTALSFITQYLVDLTKTTDNNSGYLASRKLIKLQRIEGIEALYKYVKKHKKWDQRYYDENLFSEIKDTSFINQFLVMLELFLKEDIQNVDKYDSFLSNIQKGLSSIAFQSDEAFKQINDGVHILVAKFKDKVNNDKISNINYYLVNLKDEFYRNKQNNITLQEVLERV